MNFPFERRDARVLWFMLCGSLLIRLWGIDFGLPYVYWIDEYHEIMRALELGSGEFNFARTGKGGFYFLLFFEFGLYFVFLKLTGFLTTIQEFADQFVRDPSAFYLMGRATAAAFGCATVAAAFCVGRKAYRTSAGLIGCLFLAVNVLHVDLSHRVGVDVPMTLFATLALFSAVRIAASGDRRDYLLGALFAALAATTKLPGVLALLPLGVAHIYHACHSKPLTIRAMFPGKAWLAVFAFIAVLGITNPGILLHFNLLSFYADAGNGAGELAEEVVFGAMRPNLYVFYLEVLRDSMGWPLFAVSIAAAGYATWRHRPSDVILLSFAAVNYAAIASTSSDVLYYPRYTLPIIVVLAILCGRLISELADALPRQQLTVSVVVAAILAAFPFVQAVRNTRNLTLPDTRTQAKLWFDSHVPAGSKVLIEGGKIAASRLSVPLADCRESLDSRIAYWKAREPKQARVLEIMRRVQQGGGFRLELVRVDSVDTFDKYVAGGVRFFVVRPDAFLGARKAAAGSVALLKRLRTDERVTLVKRFEHFPGANQGPLIEIYAFQPRGKPDDR